MAYQNRDNRGGGRNNFNRSGGRGGGRSFGGGGGFGGRERGFGGRRDGGRPSMHPAVCDECRNDCEVPFKPTGNRPVLCSDCFQDSKGGGRSGGRDFGGRNDRGDRRGGRDFDRPRFNDRQMHHATCNDCGNDCEVPFRPTGEKPIYCNDCFGKGTPPDKRTKKTEEGAVSNHQLEELNKKLDTVIRMLAPVLSSKTDEKEDEKTEKVKQSETRTKTPKATEAKKEKTKKAPKKEKAAKKPAAKKTSAKKSTTKKTVAKKTATKKKTTKK